MSGFWDHYTQANDDIRNTLIDRGWYEGRFGQSNAMQADAQKMSDAAAAKEQPNVKINTTISNQTNIWINDGEKQEASLSDEAPTPSPQEQNFKEVYGEDLKQEGDARSFYGKTPEQTQSADLYGYDALDVDEPDEDMTRRL